MSLLFNCFNNFIKTNYNYTDLLNYVKNKLTSGLSYSSNLDYINSLFLQNNYRNNKYFYPHNYITNLSGYNQHFIRNSNIANINEIEQLIADNDTLLGIKFKYSHIPDSPHNLLIDQIYEISQLENLFDFKNLNTSFYEKNFRNFFNHILFNQEIDNQPESFFIKYYFLVLITKIFANNNIQSELNKKILLDPSLSDIINYKTLSSDLDTYLNNDINRLNISDHITKIVLKSTYDFTSISDKFKTNFSLFINKKLLDSFKKYFNQFNNDKKLGISFQYNKYISLLTSSKLAQQKSEYVYNNRQDFLSPNYLLLFDLNKQNYEDLPIHNYSQNINSINIEKYLFCQQCHKNNPYKYLNITNDILSQYINIDIKQETNTAINILDFRSLIKSAQPYVNKLVNHKYIFTHNSNIVECQTLNGFNAININDEVFPIYSNLSTVKRVISKDITNLTLELESEYLGQSTISIPKGQFGLPLYKLKDSDAIDQNLLPTELIDYLRSSFSQDDILDIIDSENIIKFSGLLTLFPHIDQFIKSDYFNNFIDEFLNNIYKELRNNGFITYDYNWIIHKKLLTIYFNFLLKSEYLNDHLFNTINISYYDLINDPSFIINFNITDNYLTIIRDSIFNVEYRNMHQFYENMITSSLTANLIQKMIKYYV